MTRRGLLAIAVVLAVFAALLAGLPLKAHADASTGSGGLYVSQTGELWNSGDGTGGAPNNAALTANHWYTVGVDGVAGVPASGVSAVSVTFTVTSPAAAGIIHADKTGVTTPNTTVSYLDYVATGNSSGTGTIAVGSDGNIQIDTTQAAKIRVDVTGYYTSGSTAAGGYVPVQGVSVENQTRVPTGGTSPVVFSVGGTNSVPMGSSAVMLSVVEGTPTGSNGSLTVYSDGTTRPSTALVWPATRNYEWTTSVALPANGKIDLYVNSGGPVDTSVSVIGYFTASNGSSAGGQFTPGAARVYNSQSPSSPIASAATRTIQVTGVNGVPAASSAITSVAINLQIVAGSTSSGHIQAYADNAPPGASAQQFYYGTTSSAYVVVPLGPDGGFKVQNSANAAINVIVDVEGWYSSNTGALPTGPSTTGMTGVRPSATNLSFPVTDEVQAKVDVATGNLLVSTGGLSLPGVTAATPIGATYNSQSQVSFDGNAGLDDRWIGNFDGAGELSTNSTGVVWTGPDGSTWQFTAAPSSGYGDYTSPAGLHDILTSTPTGYNLLSLTSRTVITFDENGNAQTVVDKNGNTTTLGYDGSDGLASVTSTAGPQAMRVANIAFDGDNNTYYFSQYDSNVYRDIEYAVDDNGNISSYTDADGAVTTFGYSGNDLTSITSPTGAVTDFTYVPGTDKVSEIDQLNTTSGSPGTSTTRLTYPSSTQTLVAGPDTSTSSAVASVDHTSYTINGSNLVTAVQDAAGRNRGASYTNMSNAFAPTSSTVGTNGASNATYGANGGQSATSVSTPTGNASSATYGSSQASAYLPASTTDGSGTMVTTGYDGAGNALSTTTGSSGPTATLTYNTNGTVATATSPKNTTGTSTNQVFNSTKYAYNSNNQLSTITPPTGNTLGVKTYMYDDYGRVATETDGAGHTTSYTYDNDDRLLTTSFSDGTGTVTDAYDASGHELSEASASGTVHNVYDQLGHLISTTNSGGGGYEQFTYDKAGNQLTSSSQNGGTDTNTYDASGVLTQTAYPTSSGTGYLDYYVNANGVRTDEYLGATQTWNPSPTTASAPGTWTDHINTTFDASNRVTELKAYDGGSTSPTLVYDTKYCFATTTAGSATCATAPTSDTSKIQWAENMITSQLTDYTYTAGRLTQAVQSGGTTNNTYLYGYDTDGNRTSAAVEPTGSTTATSTQSFTFNSADQISNTGYTYDGDGNLTATPTATYTYNGAEQMTTAVVGGVTTNYTYEGASQNEVLTQSTSGGAAYTSTYGQGGQLVAYQDATGDSSTIFSDPVNGQASILSAGGQTGLFIDDGIDNPVGLVGAGTGTAGEDSAETYDPYGLTNYTSGDADNAANVNPYQFKNGIQDRATGLVKFGQRWYNPIDGTWTQRDTLDAPLDPSNADRYEFAGDDPINNADPSGQFSYELSQRTSLEVAAAVTLIVNFGPEGLCLYASAGAAAAACFGASTIFSIAISADGLPGIDYGQCLVVNYGIFDGLSFSKKTC